MLTPEGVRVARLFDELGMDFERAYAGRKQAQIDAVEELIRRLSPGARVLDVGCATGRPTAEQLCAKGMDVTGTDVSEVMLDHARRQVPQARYVLADLFSDAPVGLGRYDAVVSLFCLVHLPEHAFVDGLRRLAALTVPGGIILLAVPEHQADEEVRFLGRTYPPARCLSEDVRRYALLAGLNVERVEVRTEPSPQEEDGRVPPERSVFLWATTEPAASPAPGPSVCATDSSPS
ncbi:class I SAM-dependent methyltransferase [Streptomyces mobaraensis]|uniref:class I SAM-dependent methyltransferase n=1 Tax=Streptomyces mobaraensis TaxID=35621 RepID=UPI003321C78F